jgi:hypothetical protein
MTLGYSKEQFTIRAILMVPVIVFGIMSNALNIKIFASADMRAQLLNWLILAICISDMAILIR